MQLEWQLLLKSMTWSWSGVQSTVVIEASVQAHPCSSTHNTGSCVARITDPESGSTMTVFAGDEAHFFCEVELNNMTRITLWTVELNDGTPPFQVTRDTPDFKLVGPPVINESLFFNTNLTVLNASKDLDNATILCGMATLLDAASFILRVQCEYYNQPSWSGIPQCGKMCNLWRA